MSVVGVEVMKGEAEVYYGEEICAEKAKELMVEMGFPNGLIPLDGVHECGRVSETGFIWFKRKKQRDHKYEKIGKLVSFAAEVSGYVEKNRLRKIRGVKAKEFGFWISVNDFKVEPQSQELTFKVSAGPFRTYPISAFDN